MSEETIPQMREALDKANSRIKDLEKANGDLVVDNRRLSARDLAIGQGYGAEAGELFAQANPEAEIKAEALDAFIQKFPGLAAQQAASDEGAESTSASEGGDSTEGGTDTSTEALGAMSRGGSRPGDSSGGPSREMMTRQQWQQLHAEDPIAAQEAVRQGRVEISRGNPWGDNKPVARGTNPYASE